MKFLFCLKCECALVAHLRDIFTMTYNQISHIDLTEDLEETPIWQITSECHIRSHFMSVHYICPAHHLIPCLYDGSTFYV